ncbi:MAG: hypothetical protein PHR61_01420 [Candidatus Absconditabacteria bacterium]|nr:hypothetical protein [Candidatus Absconditabacteria bacterium]
MKYFIIFIKSIISKWIGVLTGTILAILFGWMPIFISEFVNENKFLFATMFFCIGLLYSVFKIWLDQQRVIECLNDTVNNKYNLPFKQKEILQKIYNGGDDKQDIISQEMFVGGYADVEDLNDLEEDGYVKISRHGTGILDLECTIKGKKYIEKRL